MNEQQKMVKAFHRALSLPSAERFRQMTDDERKLRASLILEEACEFADAAEVNNTPEMVDALCDILYVTYGGADAMGLDLEPFFATVQAANMAKVGGPTRADGKRLKPPGWTPPDHRPELERQGWPGGISLPVVGHDRLRGPQDTFQHGLRAGLLMAAKLCEDSCQADHQARIRNRIEELTVAGLL